MANLLIVDDDLDVSEAVACLLVMEGHDVTTAANGRDGMAALALNVPDALVLDIEMPVLDGPGMAHAMLIHNCGMQLVPILLISGSVELERVASRVGTPYVLAKPFAGDALIAMIRRCLAERLPPVPAL